MLLPKKQKLDKIIDSKNETIEKSLAGAWCSVVYASSSASQSIINGVPVIYDASKIMLNDLASNDFNDITNPPTPDRLATLEKKSWGQWSLAEIESGLPFRHLLGGVF